MQLTNVDWAIIASFFVVILGIAFAVARRSGQSSTEYFLSGRSIPWWLLGMSMVATTFAADTPNLVTGFVREAGVYKNWLWWAFCLTGMLTVFVYARLWRRSGVLTDMEFYELRYSGRSASFLRGFRSLYLGIVFNVLVMANVNLAAIKIGSVVLGLSPLETIGLAALVTTIFSVLGGFRGVILTDLVLFCAAMAGAFAAAYFALDHEAVGGLKNLISRPELAGKLNLFPSFAGDQWELTITLFILPIAIQWWGAWYPGAEPGGGGYIAQRMLAAKDERHAVWATLLFNIAHYALRPWPWIIVALASLVVFPLDDVNIRAESQARLQQVNAGVVSVDDDVKQQLEREANGWSSLHQAVPDLKHDKLGHDVAYPAMLRFVPAGWLGLIIASLMAAYISTISTHLNWGASYVVNDFYVRFVEPNSTAKQQVWVGRGTTVCLMVLSTLLALSVNTASQMFEVIIMFGAGSGLIFLLRWFWWRVNAWAELVAMVFSGLLAIFFSFVVPDWFGKGAALPDWSKFPLQVLLTTLAWIITTYLSPKTDLRTLKMFYENIRPAGPGWKGFLKEAEAEGVAVARHESNGIVTASLIAMFGGCFLVYGVLLGTGFLLFGQTGPGLLCLGVAVIGAIMVIANWRRLFSESP